MLDDNHPHGNIHDLGMGDQSALMQVNATERRAHAEELNVEELRQSNLVIKEHYARTEEHFARTEEHLARTEEHFARTEKLMARQILWGIVIGLFTGIVGSSFILRAIQFVLSVVSGLAQLLTPAPVMPTPIP